MVQVVAVLVITNVPAHIIVSSPSLGWWLGIIWEVCWPHQPGGGEAIKLENIRNEWKFPLP